MKDIIAATLSLLDSRIEATEQNLSECEDIVAECRADLARAELQLQRSQDLYDRTIEMRKDYNKTLFPQ